MEVIRFMFETTRDDKHGSNQVDSNIDQWDVLKPKMISHQSIGGPQGWGHFSSCGLAIISTSLSLG
jgi:hypothetical protein